MEEEKMESSKTKKMILNAILLGIGLILHQIFPALGAGITPDPNLKKFSHLRSPIHADQNLAPNKHVGTRMMVYQMIRSY